CRAAARSPARHHSYAAPGSGVLGQEFQMDTMRSLRSTFVLGALLLLTCPLAGSAQSEPEAPAKGAAGESAERDGRHDFDFEIGTWRTELRRLQNPLSGSSTWVEYTGTSVVR